VSAGTILRISVVVFAAALFQGSIVSTIPIHGGTADLLLVTVIALGLVRGSVAGAVSGFAGGIVLDLLTLDTLVTSLLPALVLNLVLALPVHALVRRIVGQPPAERLSEVEVVV